MSQPTHNEEDEFEVYGEEQIRSGHAKVPRFLTWTYILLPIWGLITGIYYWNGSVGFLDRGAWHELQVAANTTIPYHNASQEPEKSEKTANRD